MKKLGFSSLSFPICGNWVWSSWRKLRKLVMHFLGSWNLVHNVGTFFVAFFLNLLSSIYIESMVRSELGLCRRFVFSLLYFWVAVGDAEDSWRTFEGSSLTLWPCTVLFGVYGRNGIWRCLRGTKPQSLS